MEPERVEVTDEQLKARRRRSVAIALTLIGLVVLFYVVTVIRIGS